jgi:plasmid stabilization system protein ParE
MPRQVIWSPLSESDLEKILVYLQKHWNNEVTIEFLNKIEDLIKHIVSNPKQFPLTNKKRKVRKCIISKHNTLFYRESKDSIELLRIFDTRQSPKKRRFE